MELEKEMQKNLQGLQDLSIHIEDPKMYLLNVTAACLLQESKHYNENDEQRQIMTQALLKVAETDPEFVCQLGVYVRNELYISTTSNYIAAFCAVHPKTQPFIEKYFNKIILVPNDLLETCQFAQVLYFFAETEFSNLRLGDILNKNVSSKLIFRNVLQRCVRSKFLEFNDYQLGKYCTDSQRKKKDFAYLAVTNVTKWKKVRAKKRSQLLQKLKTLSELEMLTSLSNAVQASVARIKKKIVKRRMALKKAEQKESKTARIPASPLEAKYLTFKDLIAFCHISTPKLRIFKILGKKYPSTAEDYAKTFSDVEVAKEPFDDTKVGNRMKIEISTTWETELSSKRNSMLVWENLITSNQIPYLALIRNLSNILCAGVSDTVHNLVIGKLQEPQAIENSKVFPLQFFSSIQAVNDVVSKGIKAKKGQNPPLAAQFQVIKKFANKNKETRMKEEDEEATEAEQCIKVNPEAGKFYVEALQKAIKIAVNKNIEEIQGNTAIFANVSNSMFTPISGGAREYGTIRSCLECALALGLMIKQRSEKSTFYIYSSPGQNKKSYLPVDLPGDDLNPSIQKLLKEKQQLGGGIGFPYECIDEWQKNKVHFDNVVILSDVMIAQGYFDLVVYEKSIVKSFQQYKNEINPNVKIFAVNLQGKGKYINLGDEFNENNYFKIFGMSDSILKFISSKKSGFNQASYVTEFALKKIAD